MLDARKLLTLEDFYRDGGSPTAALVRRNWPYWAADTRQIEGFADSPVAFAEVNHGRWIVHCPLPGCNGAQMASRGERRFFCTDCLHGGDPRLSHRWLRVEWPDAKALEAIAHALLARPVENRNWVASETTMQLRAENAAFLNEDRWLGQVFEDD